MDKKSCADCWSPSERKMKSTIEKIKGTFFMPILLILVKLKISANMVSYASAFIGVLSTVYIFFDIKTSATLLLLSFIIDGIDGSLARISKQDNLRGSIIDCFCDQIVISSSAIGFLATGIIDPIVGGMYLVTYPLVITFSIMRNLLNKPRIYVFRPRIILYLVFALYAYTNIDIMNLVAGVLSVALLFQVFVDFYFFQKALHD